MHNYNFEGKVVHIFAISTNTSPLLRSILGVVCKTGLRSPAAQDEGPGPCQNVYTGLGRKTDLDGDFSLLTFILCQAL